MDAVCGCAEKIAAFYYICNYAPDGMLLFIRRQQGRIENHRSTQAIWRLSSALNILRLFTLGIYVMG